MMSPLKIVSLVLLLLLTANVYAEHIRLEKSTLADFVHVVSDYVDKPVMVTADLKLPFFFSGRFQTKEDLKSLIQSAVTSYGLNYDETSERILISSGKPLMAIPLPQTVEPLQKPVKSDFKPVYSEPSFLVAYPLQYLSTESVYPVLSKMVKASVFESSANNTFLVTATLKEHTEIKRYLKVLDVPVKQVLIEAVISELSDTDYAGLDSKMQNLANLNTALNDLTVYVPTPLTSMANFGMKLLTSKSLRFFLDWVHTLDNSTVLSQPKIVTLDRKAASIIVGQNVPFVTGKSTGQASSTATPFQTIERKDIGLSLHVTPLVLPNGTIQLTIAQESSSVDPNTLASDIVTNKRSITSMAVIKDGESLLLGGLSSNTSASGHTDTLPFSDIPVLGWLFSGNTKRVANTNLVVFISAKVLPSPILSIIHSALPATPAVHSQSRSAGVAGE